MKDKFYGLICLKDIISESMWYLLTGILTITASSNYIVSKGCNNSVKVMQERHAEYEKELQQQEEDSKNNDRTYYVTD